MGQQAGPLHKVFGMVAGFKRCLFFNINDAWEFATDFMYPQLDSGLVLDFFLNVFGNRLGSGCSLYILILWKRWQKNPGVQDDNAHPNCWMHLNRVYFTLWNGKFVVLRRVIGPQVREPLWRNVQPLGLFRLSRKVTSWAPEFREGV